MFMANPTILCANPDIRSIRSVPNFIKHNRNKNIKWKPYKHSLLRKLRLHLFSDAYLVLFAGNIS